MTDTFKITEPGFYRYRNGTKANVVYINPKEDSASVVAINENGDIGIHYRDGTETGNYGEESKYDIIAKWEEPEAPTDSVDTPEEERNWKRDALYYEGCLREIHEELCNSSSDDTYLLTFKVGDMINHKYKLRA